MEHTVLRYENFFVRKMPTLRKHNHHFEFECFLKRNESTFKTLFKQMLTDFSKVRHLQ